MTTEAPRQLLATLPQPLFNAVKAHQSALRRDNARLSLGMDPSDRRALTGWLVERAQVRVEAEQKLLMVRRLRREALEMAAKFRRQAVSLEQWIARERATVCGGER